MQHLVHLVHRIQEFQSANGVPIVTVVYDATHDDDFMGTGGYHYPDKIYKPVVDPNAMVPPVFTSWYILRFTFFMFHFSATCSFRAFRSFFRFSI